MSTSRRKSARSNNATNLHGQQDLENTLKRQALSARPDAGVLQHTVLSDGLCSRVWDIYDEYAKGSPQIEQRAEDGGYAAGGRGQRRRVASARQGNGHAAESGDPDGANADVLAEAATRAAEAARTWEQSGHHCIDILEPLVAGNVTLPMAVQEVLMHMVLNAEKHPGNLSGRAHALLERLLAAQPPAKREGAVVAENKELWQPVSCTWSARQHKEVPRFLGLRRAEGLAALVASAHNLVARAAGTAHRTKLPGAPEGPPHGDIGDALLLKYWVSVIKADLDVRLGALRASGYSPHWQGQLENSLAVRLMQTATNWTDGTASKPGIVKQLATTVVYSYMAVLKGAELIPGSAPEPGGAPAGSSGGGADAGGGPAALAAGGGAWGQAVRLLAGPAEVGQVAATLLNVLYDAFSALNRMRAYRRLGSVGRENDLVRSDLALAQALLKGLPFKEPDMLAALLQALSPATRVRLLVYLLADAAGKRSDESGLPEGLEAVFRYYQDKGGEEPPQFLASDVLEYLLGSEDAAQQQQHRQASGSGNTWQWAAQNFRFNGFSPRVGLALLVTTLTSATLQQAQEEKQQLAAAGAGSQGIHEEDGGYVAEAWAAEAAKVARLYARAAERLKGEGPVGGGQGEPVALLVARRCTERLADRLLGAGTTGDVQPMMTA